MSVREVCRCWHHLSEHIVPKGRGGIRGCMYCECHCYKQSVFQGGKA